MFGILELELSQEEEEEKKGGRKWEIEMGHLGHWSLSCHRKRGRRKGEGGRKEEIEMGHLKPLELEISQEEGEKEGGRKEAGGGEGSEESEH